MNYCKKDSLDTILQHDAVGRKVLKFVSWYHFANMEQAKCMYVHTLQSFSLYLHFISLISKVRDHNTVKYEHWFKNY